MSMIPRDMPSPPPEGFEWHFCHPYGSQAAWALSPVGVPERRLMYVTPEFIRDAIAADALIKERAMHAVRLYLTTNGPETAKELGDG